MEIVQNSNQAMGFSSEFLYSSGCVKNDVDGHLRLANPAYQQQKIQSCCAEIAIKMCALVSKLWPSVRIGVMINFRTFRRPFAGLLEVHTAVCRYGSAVVQDIERDEGRLPPALTWRRRRPPVSALKASR